MPRPSKYSPELRERAVRMVFDHAHEHPSQSGDDAIRRREIGVYSGSPPTVGQPGGTRFTSSMPRAASRYGASRLGCSAPKMRRRKKRESARCAAMKAALFVEDEGAHCRGVILERVEAVAKQLGVESKNVRESRDTQIRIGSLLRSSSARWALTQTKRARLISQTGPFVLPAR